MGYLAIFLAPADGGHIQNYLNHWVSLNAGSEGRLKRLWIPRAGAFGHFGEKWGGRGWSGGEWMTSLGLDALLKVGDEGKPRVGLRPALKGGLWQEMN